MPAKRKLRLRLRLTFGELQTADDGRKLAAHALSRMNGYDTDDTIDAQWPWSIEAKYRTPHTQQDNVILRCIERIQKTGTPQALAGFCSVLTNEAGSTRAGIGHCCETFYWDITEREVTGIPGPWPKLDDDEPEGRARNDAEFQTFKQRLMSRVPAAAQGAGNG